MSWRLCLVGEGRSRWVGCGLGRERWFGMDGWIDMFVLLDVKPMKNDLFMNSHKVPLVGWSLLYTYHGNNKSCSGPSLLLFSL